MPKEVDIILLSFGRFYKTISCIESLYRNCDEMLFRIIIIENGSSKETQKIGIFNLAQKYRDITVVFNNENRGVGVGRRQGVQNSNAPYFIFLDNDMIVSQGYVKTLLETIKPTSDIAAVGSKVIEGDRVMLSGRSINNKRIDYSNDNLPLGDIKTESFKYCDMIHGGATIYMRRAYNQIKIDENYFVGYEDLDMMMQFKQKNWKLAYSPKAVAEHYPTRSGKYTLIRHKTKYKLEAKNYFEKKWGILT